MITEVEYKRRIEALVAAGVDEREAGVKAILDHGLENGSITEEEKDMAITTLQSFLFAHPGFSFLSPRERYRTSGKNGEKVKNGGREGDGEQENREKEENENSGAENSAAAEEEELWSTIQLLRDAKSENFVSHWGCGIQYPKCSIETKTVQRRIIDISVFFQISYRNAIHDEQYSRHGFRSSGVPQQKTGHRFLRERYGTRFSQFGCPTTIVNNLGLFNYPLLF